SGKRLEGKAGVHPMTRRVLVGTTALIALLVSMVGFAYPAAAAQVIVRQGQSIQAAVNAASPGTTITVKAGKYAENVLITKDNIKVAGQPGATLIEPTKAVPTPCGNRLHPVGFCVAGDFATQTLVSGDTISGFTVRGFEMGVMALGASGL